MLVVFALALWRHLADVPRGARRRSCRPRTRATSSRSSRRPSGASLDIHDEHHEAGRSRSTRSSRRSRPCFRSPGFSFSGAPRRTPGLMFARLKGFEERRGRRAFARTRSSVVSRGRPSASPGALVIPVAPPAIQGISAFGGFQFEVLDLTGGDITNLPDRHAAGGAAGNRVGTRRRPVLRASRPTTRSLSSRSIATAARSLRPAGPRGDRRAGGPARFAVRQRLRLQQPRLSRLRAGLTSAFRAKPVESRSSYYARASNGDMVPLSTPWCSLSETHRAGRSSITSICSGRRRSPARPCRACSSGQALAGRWSALRAADAAGGLRLRLGGASRSKRSRPARRRHLPLRC